MTSAFLPPFIVAAIGAVAIASAALAQQPPRGGPDSPVPGPGAGGSGYPVPLGRIPLKPAEPPPPHRGYRQGRTSGDAVDSSVASVQRALKKRGYYSGPVDGDAGSRTKAAIRSFRRDHGLGYSSRIDGALLRALRL